MPLFFVSFPAYVPPYLSLVLSFMLSSLRSSTILQPLSIICRSFRDIDTYTTGFPRGNAQGLTDIFRAVKHCLPGPVSMCNVFYRRLLI